MLHDECGVDERRLNGLAAKQAVQISWRMVGHPQRIGTSAWASVPECALSGGNQDAVALPVSADQDLVLVVLREVVEDLMPRSLRADEDVRRRLERWLVDE